MERKSKLQLSVMAALQVHPWSRDGWRHISARSPARHGSEAGSSFILLLCSESRSTCLEWRPSRAREKERSGSCIDVFPLLHRFFSIPMLSFIFLVELLWTGVGFFFFFQGLAYCLNPSLFLFSIVYIVKNTPFLDAVCDKKEILV